MTQEEFSAVCPYLGLADDADSHATYATEAHRCYRLANPTRIAAPHQESYCLGANHVTCPVYLGEGVPGAEQRAPRSQAAMPPPEPPTVRGPKPGARQPFGGGRAPAGAAAGGGAPRPQRRQPNAGTLGPRPRAGGVSMPVATIGLFALAVVVIVLAFAIQQMVGDGGGDSQAPADAVATRDALNRTRTAQAGGGDTTPTTPTTPTTQTPDTRTPGTPANGTRTPANGTPSPGATSGSGTTYTVQEGDSCFAIAEANDITLQELLDANDLTEDDCTRLNVGDELTIP